MNKHIEIIRNTRKYLLSFTSELSIEELNRIPTGFNNNIIWNLAHLIAAQQSGCYNRSGVKMTIEEGYFHLYKPDTRPEGLVDAAEIDKIRGLLLTTVDRLEDDLGNNLFVNYTPWTNRYGVPINDIEDMLAFLPYHEGLHLGYIMALKRGIRIA